MPRIVVVELKPEVRELKNVELETFRAYATYREVKVGRFQQIRDPVVGKRIHSSTY